MLSRRRHKNFYNASLQLPMPQAYHYANNVEKVAPLGELEVCDLDRRIENEDRVKLMGDTKL